MIVLLRGADQVAVRRRLAQLKDDADGGTGMLTTNLTTLSGRDARVEDILGPAMTPPFLAPQRLIVVEEFLDRFARRQSSAEDEEAPAETPEPSARRGRNSLEAFEPLLKAVSEGSLPESTVLVLAGASSEKNAFVDRLKGAPGVSEEFHAAPKAKEYSRYVTEEGAARGVRFRKSRPSHPRAPAQEYDPAALLGELTNGDTLRIASELDKLALFTMGREATMETVREVCAGAREETLFRLSDAIMDGRAADALAILPEALRGSDSAQGLIGFLAGRYRQAAAIIELLEDNASAEDVGKVMGAAGRYPGLRDTAIRRARRLGMGGVRQAYAVIVETDRRIKLGELEEDVAVEMMAFRLAQLRPASGPR